MYSIGMNNKLERMENEKNNKLMLMLQGRIPSDEYYSFIGNYHKEKEKILMKKGCIHCGSKNLIEYSEESEEVVCHRCYESM
jgi:hypothetical protein